MKTMGITEFKMHALQIIGNVAKQKEPVVVTKRGKPIAESYPRLMSQNLMQESFPMLLCSRKTLFPLLVKIYGMPANEICT